jgi:hypothetical protein
MKLAMLISSENLADVEKVVGPVAEVAQENEKYAGPKTVSSKVLFCKIFFASKKY